MQINFIYDSSVQKAPAGFKQGLAIAASIIDAIILNPITVNIDIGFGEDNGALLADKTLGEAQPAFGLVLTYDEVRASLAAAATSADDAKLVQNLPAIDPSNGKGIFVSVAQSIAWGLTSGSPTEIEGYAGFSSTLPFTYNPANGIASGTYDFVGVALHELTHALGRNVMSAWLTPIDLLSYESNGKLDTNSADSRYLSLDAGKTALAALDASSDPADFAGFTALDPFTALIGSGTLFAWTALDSRLMDILGYRTASAAAAPPVAAPPPVISPSPPPAPTPAPRFTTLDVSANTSGSTNGDVYTGPVAGIQYQLISKTDDSVDISADVSNVFIRSGAGTDALSVANVSGRNVLDGSFGSNFLVGSQSRASQDTFFVDDRGATADIWSTVFNMHLGDSATVWGLSPDNATVSWDDGQGAPGFQGLTLHAVAAGKATTSLTLVGYTAADLNNGRLDASYGSVDGNKFLNINVLG
jgi:hypothetical protein